MPNIYVIAGQSNATAIATDVQAEVLARDPAAIILTISSAGAPLTWGRSGTDWFQDGDLRDDLVREVVSVMSATPSARFKSLIWVQGEADTLDIARATAYQDYALGLFSTLDLQLQTALRDHAPQSLAYQVVSVLLSENSPAAADRANWGVVITQQRALDAASGRITMVNTDQVAGSHSVAADQMFRDPLHYSDIFLSVLANAIAENVFYPLAATPPYAAISENAAEGVILQGGDGADTLTGGVADDFIFGGISPADRRDVIYGGDGNDSIDGGYGNDDLFGGNGNDTVLGGSGADQVIGNAGDDMVYGNAGSDLLHGNAGNDTLNGGFGFDQLNGGAGADTFFHIGLQGHGTDWIQDYTGDDGDVLMAGIANATRAQFQVNFNITQGAGAGDVAEAFVVYRPTAQILWALVDGADNALINLSIGGQVYDLMA
ncbi:MAG: hypothetical protein JXR75_13790 [Rhodobacteraceae bacterium]|nr:hypothetical protein [Paracoccaceae bacterium]